MRSLRLGASKHKFTPARGTMAIGDRRYENHRFFKFFLTKKSDNNFLAYNLNILYSTRRERIYSFRQIMCLHIFYTERINAFPTGWVQLINLSKREPMKTIFVVDDMSTNLMIAKSALESLYKVYALSSAEMMFKLAEKITPDMILLDIDMPIMSGFEAMQILRKNDKFSSIPVIFLTARSDEASEIKGFELGALDFINKPFTAPILLKRVEVHIEIDKLIKRIQYKNEALIRLHEAKDNILGMVSVDLRNQIVEALNICETIDMNDKVNANNDLSKIRNYCQKTYSLIKDLLLMNKMDSMESSLTLSKHDVKDVLLPSLENLKMLSEIKELIIEHDFDKEPMYCLVNPEKINRAIDNLFINAVKFTKAGGKILVRIIRNDNIAQIHIIDSGIGMDEDLIAKLFQKYTKSEKPSIHGESSPGLGLYVTKQIIDLHNGKIEVKSAINIGSEFVVKLPIIT